MDEQPNNIYQLAQLLKRPYAHVWTDCQVLSGLGIISLEKNKVSIKDNNSRQVTGLLKRKREEVRPIALYEEIIFNFPVKEIVDLANRQPVEPPRPH